MWIGDGEGTTELRQEQIFRLLEYHQRAGWNALDKYAQHLNIQVALMTALVSGGVAALVIQSLIAKFLVLFLPLGMVFLRKFTIESLDRSCRRYLEAAACSSKLEWLLQLDRSIVVDNREPDESPLFPKDRYLDVDRRWKGLESRFDTSAAWVTDRMSEGRNGVTWRLMSFIFAASLLVPLASWVATFMSTIGCCLRAQSLIAMAGLIVVIEVLALALFHSHSVRIGKKRVAP